MVSCGLAGCAPGGGCTRSAHEDPAAARIAAAVPLERVAYVTNNGSDSLSVLDLDAPGTAAAVSLDFDDRREAPHHLAVDVAANRLYVAFAHPRGATPKADQSHRAHGRSAITPGELVTLERTTLRLLRRDEVDESPGDVVLAGSRVLVTHYDLARAFSGAAAGAPPSALFATLQVWQDGTKQAERALCVAPHGIAVRDETAYVACYGSDELAIVDLRSPELPTERVPLGADAGPLGAPRFGPYSVTLGTGVAVVAELEGKALRVFDLEKRVFTTQIPLGARAMMPCFSGPALFVPLAAPDGVARVDVGSGRVEQRREFDATCTSPHVAACRADGRVLVVCEGDHVAPGAVIEIDPVGLQTLAQWRVGVYPDALAFGR